MDSAHRHIDPHNPTWLETPSIDKVLTDEQMVVPEEAEEEVEWIAAKFQTTSIPYRYQLVLPHNQ